MIQSLTSVALWLLLASVNPLLAQTKSGQAADGRITFLAADAKGSARSAGSELLLQGASDSAAWEYKPTRWGMYDVSVDFAGTEQPAGEITVELAGQTLQAAPVAKGKPIGRIYLAKADPFTATVRYKNRPGTAGVRLLSLGLTPAPEGKPIVQSGPTITLRSGEAITHSVTMRFEPATNKNCLGYWVNPGDTAEWRFQVTRPGDYDIQLWQGCGKGQGGSDVLVEVRNDQELLKETRFVVEETGHFQIFLPRLLGRVHFTAPGEYSLWVKPQRKQAGAIMDIREVRLLGADTGKPEAAQTRLPGKRSLWNGFERFDFEVDGRPVLVVCPKIEAPGRPWAWHGEFFGHKPNPDIALLGRGFYIVYMSVPDMLGCPEAVAHWNALYEVLTRKYGFAPKAALVGLSRGGLYCYNWAAANPVRVACIYGDAPVCDFKSWPGAFGQGKRSDSDWQLVLKRYGFASDAEAKAYRLNPVDNLAPLAAAHVPLLHVFGDADEVVPWQENTGVIAERYPKLGGEITLIRKPGVQHHPHGLDDSTPIVDFLWRNSASAEAKAWLAARGNGPLDADTRPLIRKLGTIDLDLVETTPVVISNRLWRFEWVRQGTGQQYWNNRRQTNYFRFRDPATGETTEPFADGHEFGSAFVHDGTVYVTGTQGRSRVNMFASRDLRKWETWPVINDGRYGIFNTSLCEAGGQFVLMFEIDKPVEEAGVAFTARFAKSPDLRAWTLTPPECNYAKDRYTAPHALKWLDGWFYDFYLEAHDGYEMRVVRSRDLIGWEPSPLNPVLRHSPEDKIIANPALDDGQRGRIANARNINNSDIDFCEWQGRLTINYSWGNQEGVEHLASAAYDGSLRQFLEGWFPKR